MGLVERAMTQEGKHLLAAFTLQVVSVTSNLIVSFKIASIK